MGMHGTCELSTNRENVPWSTVPASESVNPFRNGLIRRTRTGGDIPLDNEGLPRYYMLLFGTAVGIFGLGPSDAMASRRSWPGGPQVVSGFVLQVLDSLLRSF